MTEIIAWAVVLVAILYMYIPLMKRLYGRWKSKRNQAPSTLLGVVLPSSKKERH